MVDGSSQPGGFQWGYALVALCFADLATFRLNEGSALWAAVFGLVALANAYLSARYVLPPSLGASNRRRPRNRVRPPRPQN